MSPCFSTPTLAAFALLLASCGARSALLDGTTRGSGSGSGSGGGGPPAAPVCHSWIATSAPVQVSTTPSIVQVLSAEPVPGGVLVGYADSQLPPVDSSWHLRTVAYGDGALGPEQTVFTRNASQIGWSAISTASHGASMLAVASDEADGMYAVPIDDTGATAGARVTTSGNQGQFLAAAGSGFSVLRSPWDDTGEIPPPVSLATLSTAGDVTSETTILGADPTITDFGRVVREDQSFLLWWFASGASGGGSFLGRAFDAMGGALGGTVTLRAVSATDFGGLVLAASTTSPSVVLGVWPSATMTGAALLAQPFDATGATVGAPVAWGTQDGGEFPTMAVTGAPGGDFVVAWLDQSETSGGVLQVQAVASDGTSEGPPTMLGDIAASPETYVLLVATTDGAMVFYESDTPEYVEVFAIPLRCAE